MGIFLRGLLLFFVCLPLSFTSEDLLLHLWVLFPWVEVKCIGVVLPTFLRLFVGALLAVPLSPCPYQGWQSCMAVWEACLDPWCYLCRGYLNQPSYQPGGLVHG